MNQGTLSRREIQRVITANIKRIQRCYERAILRTPGLRGKVAIQWTVNRGGRVRSARVAQSTISSSRLQDCIVRIVRRMNFPRPRGGEVVITYPFIFGAYTAPPLTRAAPQKHPARVRAGHWQSLDRGSQLRGYPGGLTAKEILKPLRRYRRWFRSCYERQLVRARGLSGKVEVRWKIDPAGRTKAVRVYRKSSLKSGRVESCLVRRLRHVRFPRPRRGVEALVSYTFILSPDRAGIPGL